jgi:hypothetical protein
MRSGVSMFIFACCSMLLLSLSCRESSPAMEPEQMFAQPAAPPVGTPPTEALQYLAATDQGDRATLTEIDLIQIAQHRSPRMDSINRRDSIRYVALWDLHVHGMVASPADKYNAGVVFTHSGGSKIGDDSLSWRLAERYFIEASQEGDSAMRLKALDFLENVKWRLDPNLRPKKPFEIQIDPIKR